MGANNSSPNNKTENENQKTLFNNGGRDFIANTEDDCLNFLPVDGEESARRDEFHFILKTLSDGNFAAPINERLVNEDGFSVLDVGCGNGSWTLDMATEFKSANFTALDILPLFPNEIRPKNVDFVLRNILKGTHFESNTFDYVFMRCMKTSIVYDDWPKVILELLRILKPNCWLELCEINGGFINGSPEADSFFNQMNEKLMKKYGVSLLLETELLKKIFADSHLVADVQYIWKDFPLWIDPERKKLAEVCRRNTSWGAINAGQAMDFLDLEPKEYEEYIDKVFESIKYRPCTIPYFKILVRKVSN